MTVQLPVGTTQFVKRIPKNKHVLVLAICSAFFVAPAYALEKISDIELSDATGEGLAFFATDFQLQAQPGAYINLMPIGPAAGGSKANIYIYGLAISKNTNAGDMNTAHNSRFSGTGLNWGSQEDGNYFLLNVDGNGAGAPGLNGSSVVVPNLVITAPTSTLASEDGNNIRLGLWMDVNQLDPTANQRNSSVPALQAQGIWDGLSINGTKISMFATPGSSTVNSAYNNTLGLNGVLRFNTNANGVLRLSVAETAAGSPGNGVTPYSADPTFDQNEGIYLPRLAMNLPLGQPNYQPLMLSSDSTGVVLELARIPNNAGAYNQFYVNYDGTSTPGLTPAQGKCAQARCPTTATHGSIAIGDVYYNNSATLNAATNTPAYSYNALYTSSGAQAGTGVVGVTFKAPVASGGTATNGVNLGTAAIDGLMIQHLKMTLTGL